MINEKVVRDAVQSFLHPKLGKSLLDYLVIGLLPGTGDPSITIAQSLPHCSEQPG